VSNLHQSPPAPAPAHAAVRAATAVGLAEEFGNSRVLLSDIRTMFLIANEARHRVIARLFAVSRDEENLLTFVAALALVDALRERWRRLHRIPGVAAFGDGFLGASAVREVLCSIAGPSSREPQMNGGLLALAVAGGMAGPAIVKSLHGIRSGSHRMSVGFHHRYGYLIDPGHRRQQRAHTRAATERR
jgi:hypothetical protein